MLRPDRGLRGRDVRASMSGFCARSAMDASRRPAQAFDKVRRLQLRIGGSEIATWAIQKDRSDFETPELDLPAGTHFVELTSLDGAASPEADLRRLSIAVYDAELLLPALAKVP